MEIRKSNKGNEGNIWRSRNGNGRNWKNVYISLKINRKNNYGNRGNIERSELKLKSGGERNALRGKR